MLKAKLVLFAILHFVFSFDSVGIACPPYINWELTFVLPARSA
jgi:hypothetical protein